MSRLLNDHEWRRALAGADPRRLPVDPRFWRGHPGFVAVLATSLVLVFVLAPYTYSWADGWSGYLSIAVQALAVWGAFLAMRSLARLDVDTALVREMEARGSDYLVDLHSRRREQVDLDRLEQTVVPNNPAAPPPAPIRLFQHICKEARDRRFDSAGTLTQPYREEALEDIFRLQNLQKIALWLGILGTFVGLLVALQRADFGRIGGDADLIALVEEMYGGLFISFTASVAGLEVAIVLGFLLLVVRKRQEVYFAQMESAVVTLLSVARRSVNRDDFVAEFAQVNATVRDLTGGVREQTRELSRGMESVRLEVREQNARIAEGMDRLAAVRGEFDGFLARISEAEHEFLADLKRVFHAASFKDFGQALEAGVRQAGSEVSARLERMEAQNAARMEAFHASVAALAEAARTQSGDFGRTVESVTARLAEVSAQNATVIARGYEELRADAARQHEGAREVAERFDELAERLAELNRTLRRVAPARRRGRGVREFLASMLASFGSRAPGPSSSRSEPRRPYGPPYVRAGPDA